VDSGIDGFADVRSGRRMPIGEHVLMLVRHHRLMQLASADAATANDQRDLDPFARHLREPGLQLCPFGRSGQIRTIRIVDWLRHMNRCGEARFESLRRRCSRRRRT
jgi:hypothetical protein